MFRPVWSNLTDLTIWTDAATQVKQLLNLDNFSTELFYSLDISIATLKHGLQCYIVILVFRLQFNNLSLAGACNVTL